MTERFWSKVDRSGGSNACWNWTAFRDRDGYGRFQISKTVCRTSHRVSWEMENGPIPDGLCVLHKCDNPSCVNVVHLFLGTRADNNADRKKKGRNGLVRLCGDANPSRQSPETLPRGEGHANARINEQIVRAIRSSSASSRALAKQHGLGESHIYKIRTRKLWAHVT